MRKNGRKKGYIHKPQNIQLDGQWDKIWSLQIWSPPAVFLTKYFLSCVFPLRLFSWTSIDLLCVVCALGHWRTEGGCGWSDHSVGKRKPRGHQQTRAVQSMCKSLLTRLLVVSFHHCKHNELSSWRSPEAQYRIYSDALQRVKRFWI